MLMAYDLYANVLVSPPSVESPEVLAYRAKFETAIETATSPVVTKSYPISSTRQILIRPGIKVIHDAGLGNEILVTGPEKALEYFSIGEKRDYIAPGFSHAVKLRVPVEVALNLSLLDDYELTISFSPTAEGRTLHLPRLITKTPIVSPFLTVKGVPNGDVEVMADNFVIKSTRQLDKYLGNTNNVEVIVPEAFTDSLLVFPKLKYRELLITKG